MPFVYLAQNGRSAVSRIPQFRMHGRYCTPKIFFDGMSIRPDDLDDMYGTIRLEGIEVYRGHAQSPGLFWDSAGCGVILYWSQRDPEPGGVEWLRGRRGLIAIGGFLIAAMALIL